MVLLVVLLSFSFSRVTILTKKDVVGAELPVLHVHDSGYVVSIYAAAVHWW